MTDPIGLARTALAAFASGDTSAAERFIGPDYANLESTDRTGLRGPAEFRKTIDWIHESFADLRYDEIAMLADGEQVVAWVVMHGTHVAPFLGLAPEGRTFAVEQVHLFRIADGRLAGHRAVRDDLRLLLSLGARVTRREGTALKVHHR
ncbi:MAG TPA: ester cyclase [Stellaceae bacterium]|nr:ester cyclase [Stellaceae bacterium]